MNENDNCTSYLIILLYTTEENFRHSNFYVLSTRNQGQIWKGGDKFKMKEKQSLTPKGLLHRANLRPGEKALIRSRVKVLHKQFPCTVITYIHLITN